MGSRRSGDPKPPRRLSPGRKSTRAAGVVSATEAARRFGTLVDRVRDERIAYTIERGGTAVARLEPATVAPCTLRELAGLLAGLENPDADFLDEVERGVAEFNRPVVLASPWDS